MVVIIFGLQSVINNGLILQFGTVSAVNIINLPLSFTTTTYKIFLTVGVWDSNSATYTGQQRNKTINSFNVQTTASNADWQTTSKFGGYYYCIGY